MSACLLQLNQLLAGCPASWCVQVVEGIPTLGLEECFWVWAPLSSGSAWPHIASSRGEGSHGGLSPSHGDKKHLLASCLLVLSTRAKKSQTYWEGEPVPWPCSVSRVLQRYWPWADIRKEGAHLGLLLLGGVLSPLPWATLGSLSPRSVCSPLSTVESSCDYICAISRVYS